MNRSAFESAEYWIEFMESPRWVRAKLGAEFVADSQRMMLLREAGALPIYYFPKEDVKQDCLISSETKMEGGTKGTATVWSVRVGNETVADAAWEWAESDLLAGYIAFSWEKMDAWFEENDQVYRHARDPYKRIDVLHSSRHVVVKIAGEVVADTQRPSLLFETGLPTRYYIPLEDVSAEFLTPSNSHSQCPYKGIASYYSVEIGGQRFDDIVWYYPFPIPECSKIEGLLCFYNEKVDIEIDGVLQERPVTAFS